jgi:hypothetical protein
MILAVIAEGSETLETEQAKAQVIANLLNVNIQFYYNLKGYFIKPTPTPEAKK